LRTTVRADQAEPVPHLVQRNFKAEAPNQLWLADFT
jgi:putative transposase